MPPWLKKYRDDYRERLLASARRSYSQTGIWFLARGGGRKTEEQETKAVWVDLLHFCELEKLPGYSKENHQRAIKFWQSWQNLETGLLYNPLYQDPQHPEIKRQTADNRENYSPENINMKYIPSILGALGAELLIPLPGIKNQERAGAGVDTFDKLWVAMEQWNTSHAGIFPVTAARALDAGDVEKMPQVEAGMGAVLRAYNRDTGMWRPEPLEGFPWDDYQPSSGFKILSRICGYAGLENFPESLLKTAVDRLLEHHKILYKHPAMARNYGETFAHYLTLSDYRRDEILNAMEECLNGFRDCAYWTSTETSSYCIFGSTLISIFMNWIDVPFDQALRIWERFVQGCTMHWRFVAGPYGNWVNAIKKKPEEIFGNPGYNVDNYSLKARNKLHWNKKITDIIDQQEIVLNLSDDGAAGQGSLEFILNENQLAVQDSVYMKATWNGAYDIYLNGELVKQVCYNLPDHPAGFYIPPQATATLHAGKNVIEVKLTGPGKDQKPGTPLSEAQPFIRIGLINWS